MLSARDDMWIGFNDVNWEMRFLWTDGKGVQYTNWAKGYPVSFPDGRRTYGSDASVLSLLYTHNQLSIIFTCSPFLLTHTYYNYELLLLSEVAISFLNNVIHMLSLNSLTLVQI